MHWLLWGFLLWAVVIFGRLVQLQIVDHEALRQAALDQWIREVKIPALRGSILDRTGQPLAKTLDADSVAVDPQHIDDPAQAARVLAEALDLDPVRLLANLERYQQRGARFMWVKRKLAPKESIRFREVIRERKLSYVDLRPEMRRHYPHGTLAAHVLGSVGYVDETDIEHGNAGLELSFENELGGTPGVAREFTDVRGDPYDSVVIEEPVPGADLMLSIDPNVQYEAELHLAAAVEESGAASGSVVAINPHTGDILALANYPTYDPNIPPGRPGEARGARNNRAISTPFEPGSVLKVITMAAALETTRLRPDSIIDCGNGIINLFGRTIHDDHSYDRLSMAEVLAHSSNIGAINIALEVGDRRLYEHEQKFGFGRRTGIALPGESSGKLWPLEEWERSSIGSVAMGHEISVTSIQLALAASAIANGGLLMKPRLVLGRRRPGQELERIPQEKPQRILRPETAIQLRQMMEGVVLNGSGRRAVLPGYTSGGKTGSAQVFDTGLHAYTHTYNASFVGFAPVANPQIVIAVTLHRTTGGTTGYGGVRAAPVFREVAISALRMLDVPKDLPNSDVQQLSGDEVDSDLAIADLGAARMRRLPADESFPEGAAVTRAAPLDSAHQGNVRQRAVSSVTQPLIPGSTSANPGEAFRDQRPFSARGETGSGDAPAVVGPGTPDYLGMSKREVLREAAAAGLRVEVEGSGLALDQDPPPGAALPRQRPVRVQFGR